MIIDDIASAVSMLSDLGREVVSPFATTVREAVLRHVERRDWNVMQHSRFVDWALQTACSESCAWLVLDPLFPPERCSDRIIAVKINRLWSPPAGGVSVTRFAGATDSELKRITELCPDLGVIDDAAATGCTLRYANKRVEECGGQLERIVVGAYLGEARASSVSRS